MKKIMLQLSVLVNVILLPVVLYLVVMTSTLLKVKTTYAPDFNKEMFNNVRCNMSAQDVVLKLGMPLICVYIRSDGSEDRYLPKQGEKFYLNEPFEQIDCRYSQQSSENQRAKWELYIVSFDEKYRVLDKRHSIVID